MADDVISDDGPGLVMPIYIICDCSGSTAGDLPQLTAKLETLLRKVGADPIAGDFCMLSIIAFGSVAETVMPLRAADETGVLRPLVQMGSTNFDAAIREYAARSEDDVARLKADGNKVFRPYVFFLTDGYADSDDWKATFDTLLGWDPRVRQGNSNYPCVLAYGYRGATESTLKTLAYPNFGEKPGSWFLAQNADADEFLTYFVLSIAQTIAMAFQARPSAHASAWLSTAGVLKGLPDLIA